MNILEAKKIHKSYGNKFNKQEVLKGLDISIAEGEFVSIMGASVWLTEKSFQHIYGFPVSLMIE